MCFYNFQQLQWLKNIISQEKYDEMNYVSSIIHGLIMFLLQASVVFNVFWVVLKKYITFRNTCFLISFKFIFFCLMASADIILSFNVFLRTCASILLWINFLWVLRIPVLFYLESKFNLIVFVIIELFFCHFF